jgi:hypothetical protein
VSISYVKHDREVTSDQLQKYGKFATHDIHVPVLLLYELGNIQDKNGTPVNIDADFLNDTLEKTNAWIKKRYMSPFAKLKSFWSKPLENVEVIPIIKNHDTSNVDDTVGHLKGLLRIESIDGIQSLIADAVIKDPDAKEKINGDLLRNTSVGIREDGSIKEVSFVINEAAPHGGLMMSEKETKKNKKKKAKNSAIVNNSKNKELEFAEKMNSLQFEERQLEEVIIPNHMILSRMIKTGKIPPWKYEKLITEPNRGLLEMMETSLPSIDLGLMIGTQRHPEKVDASEMMINNIIAKYQKNNDVAKQSQTEIPRQQIEIINQAQSFEETRIKELKHLLELAEHSPEILSKYLKIELGEPQSTEDCELKDTQLAEYIQKSKDIKNQLKQLQLGEIE